MIFRTSPEIGGMGHSIKRKEDLRFHPGQRQLCGRCSSARHGVWTHGAEPLCACAPEEREHREGQGSCRVFWRSSPGRIWPKSNLAWMPTLFFDKQMVLATGKVLFQSQEVAFVVAEDQYTAADAAELVEVEYEELPVLVDPHKALDPALAYSARGSRREDQPYLSLGGRRQGRPRTKSSRTQRSKPRCMRSSSAAIRRRWKPAGASPTSIRRPDGSPSISPRKRPHAHRTLFALVGGIPENNIRVISPDIGGGFGNKVPIYPGYVCAVVASLTLGRPVKWIETRSENLQSTGFARDYHMTAELAASQDGKIQAMRVKTLADHGAFNAAAQPTKFPAGLFSICTGAYDYPTAFCEVDGVYTNKAPGGIAYRCSFRVTEAAYLIERAVDVLAQELKVDPVELRRKNFIPPGEVSL